MERRLTVVVTVVLLLVLNLQHHSMQASPIAQYTVHSLRSDVGRRASSSNNNRNRRQQNSYDVVCGICTTDKTQCPQICKSLKEYSHLFG
ncbi:hypothetical protein V1264_008703 [Littorina saxatilis]|uniref:Uncharacterized protein n=1 Tax=Littorina saxatilis TaxID=31220 RepID=A0AAN9G351_9CAEN